MAVWKKDATSFLLSGVLKIIHSINPLRIKAMTYEIKFWLGISSLLFYNVQGIIIELESLNLYQSNMKYKKWNKIKVVNQMFISILTNQAIIQILTVLDFKRCWEQIGWDTRKKSRRGETFKQIHTGDYLWYGDKRAVTPLSSHNLCLDGW